MELRENKKKNQVFHWGWGITLAILLGAGALIFLVVKSSQVPYDMVMEDYYEAEIDYEDNIRAQKRFEAMDTPFEVFQNEDVLILQFPLECLNKEITESELKLYRPASKKGDINIPLELDRDAQIMINKEELQEGNYILRGDWYLDDVRYAIDKHIFIKN